MKHDPEPTDRLQRGYTGILLMNKIVSGFLQKVREEGGQAMIKIVSI